MVFSRPLRRALSGFAAGFALALAALPALAAPPAPHGDLAGAPRRLSTPAPAALTITVRTCAAGYDSTAAVANPLKDCRQPAGDTSFALRHGATAGPSASTGDSGSAPQQSTVRFTNLTPGRYTVTATAPKAIGGAFVAACTSTVRDLASPFVPLAVANTDGAVTLDLQPGETLACDWYQVEADATAS